jgi:hypothetical protein
METPKNVPQELKPHLILAVYGTDKSVPFQNSGIKVVATIDSFGSFFRPLKRAC